jgi:hypothetical protein
MITSAQHDYIEGHAYVPEHVPHYVTVISESEPFLLKDFLIYAKKDHLIFVGYPLEKTFEEKRMKRVLEEAIKALKPESVSLMAPSIPSSFKGCVSPPTDDYYRLDFSTLSISQKLRNMLSRAGRELSLEKNRSVNEEHRRIVDDFLKTHPVDASSRLIFERIGDYLTASNTTWVFEARNNRGELVAFDVAEFKPRDYAIYMFNFSSDPLYVPGASDLLLFEVIEQAKMEKKKYINLGLGINPGVTFFKKKWGATAFLPYAFCLFQPSRKENLETLLQRL